MLLHIATDGVPIYQQIVDQIRFRIVSGQLAVGDELPTIRGLAEIIRVNPNTVARAYRELEQEGLVEKRRTVGTFVADSAAKISVAQRRKLLQPHLDRVLIQARQLGVSLEELLDQLSSRNTQLDQIGDSK
ncbi:MAG: GntR family transcriptional regulator [Planctomycetaceae bacterium]